MQSLPDFLFLVFHSRREIFEFRESLQAICLHTVYQSVYLTFKIHSDSTEISQLN